ncbi:MAG: hypothetical protein ACRD1N_05715 [Terriglobia bacterium]
MKAIVVGGHTRNIGKTSVAAGLIRAFPSLEWTAVKITQYGHGVCSRNGRRCDCAPGEHSFALSEEKNPAGRSDTSRFLAAGARRSLWLRVRQGELAQAFPALEAAVRQEAYVLFESNSILDFLNPLLYLVVLDGSKPDFKRSARRFLGRADALIVAGPAGVAAARPKLQLSPLRDKPSFPISLPDAITPELASFVGEKLAG